MHGWVTRSTQYVVEEMRKVALKMSFEKELTLNNILYVPDIRNNLISGSLLNKFAIHMIFESDIVVLSKSKMYVDNDYVTYEFFKLNVMIVVNKNEVMYAYLLESFNL